MPTCRRPSSPHCEGRAAAELKGLGAGIAVRSYDQKAIAARLVASRPHGHVARQWFRSPDVLALLPFDRPEPERSYALVWSLPDRAGRGAARGRARGLRKRARAAPPAARPASCAWRPSALPGRSPSAAPPAWCGPGWVLAGDAAHLVHPLAGQGLNLGLGDVAALVSVIEAREPWRRLGDERLLRRYVRLRAAPTSAMLRITDGLLRLFAEDKAADPRTPQQWPVPRQSDLAAQALAHRAGARLLTAAS